MYEEKGLRKCCSKSVAVFTGVVGGLSSGGSTVPAGFKILKDFFFGGGGESWESRHVPGMGVVS